MFQVHLMWSAARVTQCLCNRYCTLIQLYCKDRVEFYFHAVPDEWATVSIHNSTGENALNNTDYTLTCTVTVMEGMTLPVTVEWVGPDGSVVVSEVNRMVREVEVQGRVSTLILSFSPVISEDGGKYTCRAAIFPQWMSSPLQKLAMVDMPVTSKLHASYIIAI